MATWYIDNRATGGTNAGTSPANAWLSLYDSAYGTNSGSVAAGDTVVVMPGSGPYRESTNSSSTLRARGTDISFNAGTRTITTLGAVSFAAFTAGKTIEITGSQSNDGFFLIASNTATTIVVNAIHNLVTESAGRTVRIVDVTDGTNNFVFDQGRNGGVGNPIVWKFNRCEASSGRDFLSPLYKWTKSAAGTNEYYLQRYDGSAPGVVQVDCCSIDGIGMCASAADPVHSKGTLGSLRNKQFGWGNNDALAYSTLYVRSDNGNPQTSLKSVIGEQNTYILFQNWGNHTFEDMVVSYASSRLAGANMRFNRCAAIYSNADGWQAAQSGPHDFYSCITFWTGHRGYQLNGNITMSLYNCTDRGAHLFALINTGAATGTLNVFNCISSYNESGFIDKKTAGSTLNEGANVIFPRFVTTEGLAYINAANWPKTASTDVPASCVTDSVTNYGSLIKAGGADPKFVYVDDSNFWACDFRVQNDSPARNRGVTISTTYTDFNGDKLESPPGAGALKYSDSVVVNPGIYQKINR